MIDPNKIYKLAEDNKSISFDRICKNYIYGTVKLSFRNKVPIIWRRYDGRCVYLKGEEVLQGFSNYDLVEATEVASIGSLSED